eukprot:GHVT01061119.1.p1 GENE.GHVT01061119.1~~GHVT01061119.1.p1  ORF type:complete len:105 (+),score=4.90 GHVT01061119.1:16-330(+)
MTGAKGIRVLWYVVLTDAPTPHFKTCFDLQIECGNWTVTTTIHSNFGQFRCAWSCSFYFVRCIFAVSKSMSNFTIGFTCAVLNFLAAVDGCNGAVNNAKFMRNK